MLVSLCEFTKKKHVLFSGNSTLGNTVTNSKYYGSSENKPFVVKPVSDSIFRHLEEFKTEFNGNLRLRIHVDQVDKDRILIYEFFKTDLRSLIEKYPPLPIATKKAILKEVALVLNDMHEKEWIHLGKLTRDWILGYTNHFPDVKPDNIFIDWDFDSARQFRLQKIVLGDMDCALKLNGKDLLNFGIGNVRWRSPEGQVGRGVGKPSEVFTFALLVGSKCVVKLNTLLTGPSSAYTPSLEHSFSILQAKS